MRIVWGVVVVVVVVGLSVWRYQEASTAPTGLKGIWTGQLLDANDKAVANVEWTISPMNSFTGMMVSVDTGSKAEPMQGQVSNEGRVEGAITTKPYHKSFEGNTVHSQKGIEGTIIIKSHETDAEEVPFKIRLQRK